MANHRVHPVGSTAADRAKAAELRILAAGGRRLRVFLSPAATDALAAIRQCRGLPSDTAAIEALLVEAASRPTRAPARRSR